MLVTIRKYGRYAIFACAALLLAGAGLAAEAEKDEFGLTFDDRAAIKAAVGKWIKGQCEGSENEHGKKTKRGYSSRNYRPAEDGLYEVTVHIETAGDVTKTTERYLLNMRDLGDNWEVAEHELKDSFPGTHRESHAECLPFDKMSFDREGLRLSATNGMVCKSFLLGNVNGIVVNSADMSYRFEPPEYARALHLEPDFHSVFQMVKKDHKRELEFDPDAFLIGCDPETCVELLDECFEGLEESAVVKSTYEHRNRLGPPAVRSDQERAARESVRAIPRAASSRQQVLLDIHHSQARSLHLSRIRGGAVRLLRRHARSRRRLRLRQLGRLRDDLQRFSAQSH